MLSRGFVASRGLAYAICLERTRCQGSASIHRWVVPWQTAFGWCKRGPGLSLEQGPGQAFLDHSFQWSVWCLNHLHFSLFTQWTLRMRSCRPWLSGSKFRRRATSKSSLDCLSSAQQASRKSPVSPKIWQFGLSFEFSYALAFTMWNIELKI